MKEGEALSELTPKQKAFADYYIQSGNATQAAIKAGYSEKYTNTNANKLLQNTTILEYIQEQNKAIESTRIADMKEVKEFWSNVLRDNKVDFKDRLKASEYIAKTNAAFIEKTEIDIKSLPKITLIKSGDGDEE